MNSRATRAMALAAAAALALAGAGCGSDDDNDNETGGGESAQEPSRLAIELSGPPKKPTFDVPASVEGGVVEIEFTSSVEGEHSAQFVGAEAGHTPQEALEAGAAWADKGKALPDWAILPGGTGDVKQGESTTVTQQLPPGSYLVADLASNVTAEFEVTGDGGGGEVAAEGGTITATEYAFESDGLKAGRNTVLFDNAGQEPHLVAAIGIKEGSTFAEVRRFFRTEKGEPPIDDSRGFSTAVVDGGIKQAVELDLEAGRYALICFIPDRKGGPPHVAKGMISEATVAE
jgi:hypothetical protein